MRFKHRWIGWWVIGLLLVAMPAAAQSQVTGRTVSQADWVARFPALFLIILFTVGVTAAFAIPAWRKARQMDEGGE